MYTIKIMLDFLHGPIWVYGPEGVVTRGKLPLVEQDPVLKKLDKQGEEMYTQYYEFDSHEQACWFDTEREKAESPEMLSIIRAIKQRLDEINDGSFVVEDYVTTTLEKLAAQF